MRPAKAMAMLVCRIALWRRGSPGKACPLVQVTVPPVTRSFDIAQWW
jgi:hypothetical protein